MKKEIEFVCYNEDYPDSTPKRKLKSLYRELKKLDGVLPYSEDCGDSPRQVSLAAVLLKHGTEKAVRRAAKKHGVAIDIVHDVPEWKIDEIIRGELPCLHKWKTRR